MDNTPKDPMTVNIANQLSDGVAPIKIYKDLVSQFVPVEDIDLAFKEIGYDAQTISNLSAQASKMIEAELADTSIQEGKIKQYYGGGSIFFL
ncbi:MAG: hypothetical protein CM15mV42_0770 [uncultured marine virus]|nr:MAG: hypothetical protein CM15mV42_0770 [uncultured marine virus]